MPRNSRSQHVAELAHSQLLAASPRKAGPDAPIAPVVPLARLPEGRSRPAPKSGARLRYSEAALPASCSARRTAPQRMLGSAGDADGSAAPST